MSLVGTRPPTVDEWELYEPHHRARMSFRPGLTGMWQVSGRSNITDFEEVVKLDTQYMSELAAPLKIYPQVLENVRVTDKKAAQNDPAVQEAVNTVAEALGDTGRILVRESGTEPVVRVMVEAPDHDTCQKYVNEVVAKLVPGEAHFYNLDGDEIEKQTTEIKADLFSDL